MDYSFIWIIILIMLDLTVCFKPQVPLLNLFFGLFTGVFNVIFYNSMPTQPMFLLFSLFIAIVTILQGIKEYMK